MKTLQRPNALRDW